MSTTSVKLRALLAWIVLMPVFVSMPLAHIWALQSYARISRELAQDAGDRDRLNAEVMRLETETRGLRALSRLEDVARSRLGMIDPGPPVLVRPGSSTPGDEREEGDGETRVAMWKGWKGLLP